MNSLEIRQGGSPIIEVQSPSNWNELTPDQFQQFLKLRGLGQSNSDLLYEMGKFLIGPNFPSKFRGLTRFQVDRISETLLFLVEESNLARQLIPKIKIGSNTFYGPSDGLTNLKFWEFLKAHEQFIKFSKSGSEADLNKFLAIIYRKAKRQDKNPEKYDGDIREKFNENLISDNAKVFSQENNNLKEGVIIFWKGSCTLLQTRFPDAFTGGEIKNEYGPHGLADAMAGTKFGRVDQVKEAWLYEVLISACNLEKMRRQIKKS
jgi:hypothetical protein